MRILSFIIFTLTALYLPFWFFILCALGYAIFVTNPCELIIVGICIDATYGDVTSGLWFAYTSVASCICLASATLRPYFIFHT
jgi:hypothetical protein